MPDVKLHTIDAKHSPDPQGFEPQNLHQFTPTPSHLHGVSFQEFINFKFHLSLPSEARGEVSNMVGRPLSVLPSITSSSTNEARGLL